VTVSDGASTVTSVAAALRLAGSTPWTWRNPTTTGNDLWSVAHGAGRFVAVGRSGTLLTSTDGSTWEALTPQVPTLFTHVAYLDARFVVVGSSGNVLTSPDGLSWTRSHVGQPLFLYGVARSASAWVITGAGGAIFTSGDGTNWTRVPAAAFSPGEFTATLAGVTATANGFLAVSVAGHVLTGSVDGSSWTVTQPAPGVALYDVRQRSEGGTTTTVIAGASQILRSTDGTTWTKSTLPVADLPASVDWQRLQPTSSGWVVVGGNFATTFNGYLLHSLDGATWSLPATLAAGPQFLGVTHDGATWVAVGTVGRIARSADGSSWQNIYTAGLTFPGELRAAAAGPAGTLVAGRVGQVYLATNHETGWLRVNLGQDATTVPGTTGLYGATHGAGKFVLVGGNDSTTAGSGLGYILSSDLAGGAAASSWTRVELPGISSLTAVAHDAVSGRFVTAGTGAKIHHARNPALASGADGWTAVDKPAGSTAVVRAAAAAGGRFVLVGDGGAIFTSTDGVAWVAANSGTSVSLEAVAGNGSGVFVAGGRDEASSVLLRSTDQGATWSRVVVPFTGTIRGMTYADGRFRTVGGAATMLVSADQGVTWTAEPSQFSQLFRAIVRTPRGYVAAGTSGAVATLTQPTVTPAVASVSARAGDSLVPVVPVTATGGVAPYTYAVSPALPAGLQFDAATGRLSGTPAAAAATPPFAGADDFGGANVSSRWVGFYRTLGSAAGNGLLAANPGSGRLDFTKSANAGSTTGGSYFLRWDGDPAVAGSSRTTASYATSWQTEVTVTNQTAATGSEYSSIGLQTVGDGGWAAIMITRTAGGVTVRGESSSIAFASSPTAPLPSGEAIRLRLSWDAAGRVLKGAYSVNGGASYTELLTLGVATWLGGSDRGLFHEIFANSTVSGAVAAGTQFIDDFTVTAQAPHTAVHTVSVVDAAGVSSSASFSLLVNPAIPLLNVDTVVRSWSLDPVKVSSVVNGLPYRAWREITAGLGSRAPAGGPPAQWGRVMGWANFTSLAGESGLTFRFGDLTLDDAAFVSGEGGNNGGITVQEYVPHPGSPTPIRIYDSAGAVLAEGLMERVISRTSFTTGQATGEATFWLTAAGPAARAAAFLQEINQFTGGTGRMRLTVDAYSSLSALALYHDYLGTGRIAAVAGGTAPPPTILAVSPQPVVAGGTLTVTGVSLPSTGAVTAKIGTANLTDVVANAPALGITAAVPANVPLGAQLLTLTLPGGGSASFAVQVAVQSPLLTGLTTVSPSQGAVGETLRLNVAFTRGSTELQAVALQWTDPAGGVFVADSVSSPQLLTTGEVALLITAPLPLGTYRLNEVTLRYASGSGGGSIAYARNGTVSAATGAAGAPATHALNFAAVDFSVALIQAPAITAQPQSRTLASAGGEVTFSVSATGYPAPTYQWSFRGQPLAGATASTLLLTGVQPAAVGSYAVVVTNSVGSVTSAAATLEIRQPGNTGQHAVEGGGYLAGGQVTVTNTLTYAGIASALNWSVLLPPGWSLAASSAVPGATPPSAGQTDLLEWNWSVPPAGPVAFSYVLNVPVGTSAPRQLAALAGVRNGDSLQFLVTPDPLTLQPQAHHSADTDRNARLGLLELTRVIELYNTRNGGSRTGGYAVATTTTEDGFSPDPARPTSMVVTLTAYHSADVNRDGRIALLELTRVIELYNYRSGGSRTGQYKPKSGTEDGFDPGP
jgi:hypothetical protein